MTFGGSVRGSRVAGRESTSIHRRIDVSCRCNATSPASAEPLIRSDCTSISPVTGEAFCEVALEVSAELQDGLPNGNA